MSKCHYVYRVTNLIKNKHYYGCRTTEFFPKEDLGKKYFTSSKDKDFIKDQKQNPNFYKYKIIKIFKTRKEAIQFEIKLHNYFNVGVNESFYNRAKQTSTGFDTTDMALYIDETGNEIFLNVIEAIKRNLDAKSKGSIFHDFSYQYWCLLTIDNKIYNFHCERSFCDELFRKFNRKVFKLRYISYIAWLAVRVAGIHGWKAYRQEAADINDFLK